MRKRTEFLRFDACGDGRNKAVEGKTLVASSSLCCDLHGGVLRAGVGVQPTMLPDGTLQFERTDVRQVVWIPDCYFEGNDGWLVMYYDGSITLHTSYETLQFEGDYKDVCAVAVATGAGENVPVLHGKTGVVRLDKDGVAVTMIERAHGVAACYVHDRFFYLSAPETIAYSKPTQPFDFTSSADDAGEIEMVDGNGEIVKLMPYGDAVYVFKEYAILRFAAVGAARDFRVETLAYNGGRIEGKSVVAFDGGIFFAAQDGIYRFDGAKCVRLTDGLPMKDASDFFAVTDGWRYYLSYETDTGASTWVTAADGDGYCIPNMRVLGQIGDKALTMIENRAVVLMDGADADWGRNAFTFNAYLPLGNDREKTVTGVTVYGVGDVEIMVRSERKRENKHVEIVGGVGKTKLAVKGKEFFCALRVFPKTCVEKIVVEYQELEGSV